MVVCEAEGSLMLSWRYFVLKRDHPRLRHRDICHTREHPFGNIHLAIIISAW